MCVFPSCAPLSSFLSLRGALPKAIDFTSGNIWSGHSWYPPLPKRPPGPQPSKPAPSLSPSPSACLPRPPLSFAPEPCAESLCPHRLRCCQDKLSSRLPLLILALVSIVLLMLYSIVLIVRRARQSPASCPSPSFAASAFDIALLGVCATYCVLYWLSIAQSEQNIGDHIVKLTGIEWKNRAIEFAAKVDTFFHELDLLGTQAQVRRGRTGDRGGRRTADVCRGGPLGIPAVAIAFAI